MSAQKITLAALLAAAVVATPAAAKPEGKDRGPQAAKSEQKRGGGQARGGGKHREARQAAPSQAEAVRQATDSRGKGRAEDRAKQARKERDVGAERFAAPARQRQEATSPKRWEGERQRAVAVRDAAFAGDRGRDLDRERTRKLEKQVARQQRAAYRGEAKQRRDWAKQQRQAVKQAARIVPVVAYQPPFVAAYAGDPRYALQPAYFAPAVRTFSGYPAYAPTYAYSPRYSLDAAYGASSYPQNYAQWSAYPAYGAYPAYAGYTPYDAGYGSNGLGGLGGLFGGGLFGGGGFGDILVALLPLLLGDGLGLGGLTGGAFDTGFNGGPLPASYDPYAYGSNDYISDPYANPTYIYADAPLDQGLTGSGESVWGGDALTSLLPLVLESGLLGDSFGGLGGLSGLGGGLGLENALGYSNGGFASPGLGYAPPYASQPAWPNVFGV